ncbi:mucin-associated surface protein (MASP), putative, partial [Trypanosoma cruzi marinkellei]
MLLWCVTLIAGWDGAWLCALSLLLIPLCVDGELVCAEGCTQVIGVMAMMMTGRVLLVCALCVLWCGAGGGDAWALSDDLHKQYYGANSTYCTKYSTVFNCNNKNENKDTLATDDSVTERSNVEREDGKGKGDQKSESGSSEHTSHAPVEDVSVGLGKDGNIPDANSQGGKETGATAPAPPAVSETEAEPGPETLPPPTPLPAPPAPPPPPEPSNVPNSTNPDQSATPSGTTGIQSTHQQQSQSSPAAGNPTATGDSSSEPQTAAASDATGSTPAGGDDEQTSPSPAGQAAASGPGENSAAEGTPDGTPPSVAAVTHDDNANTTDTATGEGNSTAASMPAPLPPRYQRTRWG